jgi:SAM-dependent methyltransferase
VRPSATLDGEVLTRRRTIDIDDAESRTADQYADALNLKARIALHERFSTNGYAWPRWVFDQFDLPDEARLLEIGCGTGGLWSGNFDRIPDGWEIILTDASPGMVVEAKRNLGNSRRFAFRVADVQELPFEGGIFDAVVANHMLYPVPNRPRAFSEIARVLREGGMLYAATNGMKHLREFVGMVRILDPTHRSESIATDLPGFSLENGAGQLSPWFPEVSLRRYEDALIVTEAKALVDFLLSTIAAQAASKRLPTDEFRERVSELTKFLERQLASHGAIRVTKEAGMFLARS